MYIPGNKHNNLKLSNIEKFIAKIFKRLGQF